MFSDVAFAVSGDDLVVSFDLMVDGEPGVGYDSLERGYRQNGTDSATILDAFSALTDNGDGSYSFTITGGNLAAGDNRYLFRVSKGGDRETRVYAWGDFPGPAFAAPAVSADACGACHGPEGINIHGGYYTAADVAEPCLVCHGGPAPWNGEPVPSLAAVAHGLHNGIWEDNGEVVEITYPTYMTNCSVCHSEDAQLAAANAMPVSGAGCFTCHGSMDSWDFAAQGLGFHLTIVDPETSNCGLCHGDNPATPDVVEVGIARANAAEMHNGARTGRGGIIFDGVDTAVTEGAKFDWQITGVVDDGVNLAISWTASYDGNGVDPCNATVAEGAPVFFAGADADDLAMYRSYAQGDDFIIGTEANEPGQADDVDLSTDNTTCADGVATTTIPVDAAIVAEKGRVALGGKPVVVSVLDPAETMEVRVPTPTYDWVLGTSDQAVARRSVVDTDKCLGCHVGSLYQHGGDRVDNVDMCLVCHNAASNEKNVRVGMGVDASEAYDGKVGETFEMKTMLHRIHSAGEEGQPPYLVYRNRGIYAFAQDVSQVPNWPTVDDCVRSNGSPGRTVFGSDPANCQPHNFEAPTYPRSLNECTACHTEDFMVIPDQTQSMATTTDAGSTEWLNQVDDVLQGAATTACVTCHTDGASKGHAYQNSWTPQAFPEGRQTIIDSVN
jgi:OmcA/MtrC family decaheme c-type cytochrome